jgi:sigma-E factor negative regulatory protein RseA
MSEHKEQLSAYLDDALPSDEANGLLQAAGSNTAARYHLIGDAMRGELSEFNMLDVSHPVREAIAHETMTHETIEPIPAALARRVGDKPGLLAGLFDVSGWMRPLGGLAVAASVAMMVVVSLQDGDVDSGLPAQAIASADAPQIVPVSKAATTNLASTGDVDLDRYMDEHSEFAARDTMQGRLPYVRAVGYKSQ